MARKGENIYKRKDGRWEGRWIYCYDENGKAHYRSIYAKSYTEVKELLSACKVEIAYSQHNSARKTLQYFCEEWLSVVKLKNKESTYCKYRTICLNHINTALGKYPITKISTELVEQFLSQKINAEHLSSKTVNSILCILKMVFDYANQNNYQTICNFSVLKIQQNTEAMRILSVEEQKRFTEFLLEKTDLYKLGVYLSLYTGIRIGELCALQWKHISFEKRILYIVATMQRISANDKNDAKTKIVITPPKSKSSVREIPITNSLMKLLEQYRCSENAFLLTGEENRFCEPRIVQYHFRKFVNQCNIENINFHALRHTFATRCVEAGFEIKTLSEILGHSSVNITLNRYVHSSMDWKRSNMEKLEKFL